MRIIICLIVCIIAESAAREIPEKFLGKWQLDRSEQFDEYLSARGVNWFVRKMILMTSVSKSFEKASEVSSYNYYRLAMSFTT